MRNRSVTLVSFKTNKKITFLYLRPNKFVIDTFIIMQIDLKLFMSM